ncbi:unnamed protein product, partial [Rotaria sp. Silwood1]
DYDKLPPVIRDYFKIWFEKFSQIIGNTRHIA